MARIIPKVDLSSITNGGERIIATELVRQLRESCSSTTAIPGCT